MRPLDVVRSYEIENGAWSSPELEGRVHITGVRRPDPSVAVAKIS